MVVFDFDQTLSAVHVFKSLAGWKDERSSQPQKSALGSGRRKFQVPAPYACSELGQIRRIDELDRDEFSHESFAVAAFGGEARVQEVREHLQLLHDGGIQLVICSKGMIGPIRKCLTQLGMLHFFSQIYGNIGKSYGSTPYDKETLQEEPTPEEKVFLGSPDMAGWRAKDKVISKLMTKMGLVSEQVVLVEDDPSEIRRASSMCLTLHVREASGVTSEHWDTILKITECDAHGKSSPEMQRVSLTSKPRKSTGSSNEEGERYPSAPPVRTEEKEKSPTGVVRITRQRSRSASTLQVAAAKILAA